MIRRVAIVVACILLLIACAFGCVCGLPPADAPDLMWKTAVRTESVTCYREDEDER